MILTNYNGVPYDISSASGAVAVTPSDGADLARGATKGLYIGGAGNVAIITSGGDTVTFNGLTIGNIHPISVKRVLATGTTATNIVAVY